jgi:hypothetical protein
VSARRREPQRRSGGTCTGSTALSLAIVSAVLVVACVTSSGVEQDQALSAGFASAMTEATPGSTLSVARLFGDDATGAVVTVFANSSAAHEAISSTYAGSAADLWPGPGGGAIVTVTNGGDFAGWFAVADSVARLDCLAAMSSVELVDHEFRVGIAPDGSRALYVDGADCGNH